MSLEENKELVSRLVEEVYNKGNMSAIDELLSVDLVLLQGTDRKIRGSEAYKQNAIMASKAFPDVHMEIHDIFTEGDKVACRWTLTGTQKGEYQGIPATGKQINVQGINIFRIADGKIVEIWARHNTLGMMQQLGLIPPMGKK